MRLAVHGDRGTGVMEDDRLSVFAAASGLAPGPDDVEERSVPEGWSAVDVAHLRQYRDVLDAIAQGRAPAITTRESTEAIGHDIPAAATGWSRWTFWIDPVF